jgi:hypothetical protein
LVLVTRAAAAVAEEFEKEEAVVFQTRRCREFFNAAVPVKYSLGGNVK